MKQKIMASIVVIVICLLVGGIGADDEPEKRVMKFIAVMDLKCGEGIKKDQCAFLTDIVIKELVKAQKYRVIDRANRDKILGEVGFQQTGCVEGSCTVEAGRILGVGKIVIGAIIKLGGTYAVALQLINVENAEVELAVEERCKKCEIDELIDTVAVAARKLMGRATMPVSTDSPDSTQPPSTHVKVTDASLIENFSNAIKFGYPEKVRALLADKPSLINAEIKIGKTYYNTSYMITHTAPPLYYALMQEKINNEIIKLLLSNGADINKPDSVVGDTPLHLLAYRGNNELFDLFLSHRADIRAIDNEGRSVLYNAALGGNKRIFDLLINKGGDINAKSKTGSTILHAAAWGENIDIIRFLISKGLDVNLKSRECCSGQYSPTPLHRAAAKCNVEVVSFLLSKGAKVNPLDRENDTPLCYAKSAKKYNHKGRGNCSETIKILNAHGGHRGTCWW